MDHVDRVLTDLPVVEEIEHPKQKVRIAIIDNDRTIPEFSKNNLKANIFTSDTLKTEFVNLELPEASRSGLLIRADIMRNGDMETDNFFLKQEEIPDIVIIGVPSQDSFSSVKGNHYQYQYMYLDWFRTPPEKRPQVIMYTNGFKPRLGVKSSYNGFLFCSSPEELNETLILSKQLSENRKVEIYNPKKLEVGQKDAYDNSDLREWENKTADTYQSLKIALERFNERNKFFDDTDGYNADSNIPEKQVGTILDLGTGEGRIAGMLARCGYHVIGLDISKEQLDRSRSRVIEEGQCLRGEKEDPNLSYKALEKLKREGIVSTIDISDRETLDRYLVVQGSFFKLDYVLNRTLTEWYTRYPDIDPYAFFGVSPFNEYVFSNERNMFADVGFDTAMINWHTFCEMGSPDNEKEVLGQILNVLCPGGELMIEIPDRMGEPYGSSLKKYYVEHPDEPYGTIRDPKPENFKGLEGQDLYPPRYFPDVCELALLLKSVGYEMKPDEDIKNYTISYEDRGEKKFFKEYFITARKSKSY